MYWIGKLRCFGRNKRGQPLVSIGPNWPIAVFVVCFVVILAGVFQAFTSGVLSYIGIGVFGFLELSFLMASLKDCGVVVGLNCSEEEDQFCELCGAVKQFGTVHCRDCDVCVRKFDHHCVVTGKCIGAGNIKWFHAFLSSIMCGFLYLIIAIVLSADGNN
mmetsp:Transcript_4950/g.7452  ORF Transcript_4950/g.7452 Transcript_4950/m.7452 type:complete len:160 (+) Transcript_4950:766-1245(+)